jgi:hypothetical protein
MNPKHIEPRVYSDYQYREIGALVPWNILLDIHNAMVYGFAQNRLPEPGRAIDIYEAEAHVANIEKEWQAEKHKRDFSNEWTGAPPLSRMPVNGKLYLHSVLCDAWQGNSRDKPKEKGHWFDNLLVTPENQSQVIREL